jgi:hypothetical protein
MRLFNRLEHELCRLVNDAWISASKYCGLNGNRKLISVNDTKVKLSPHLVIEYGDDINSIANERALCLVNHLGLIDHFCLMTSFHNKKDLASKVRIRSI